jgi:hypothetical protein
MTTVVVQPAATAAARLEVFRFRYERGVRPTDTLLPGAQLVDGMVQDRLDPLAILIVARHAVSQVVLGAARINLAHEGLADYPQLYGFTERDTFSPGMSVTSGWVTAWDLRGLEVPLALARGVYDVLRRERIVHDYLDCSTVERPFFERLGYHFLRLVRNPVRGETHLMRLAVPDDEYRNPGGSPLPTDAWAEVVE